MLKIFYCYFLLNNSEYRYLKVYKKGDYLEKFDFIIINIFSKGI